MTADDDDRPDQRPGAARTEPACAICGRPRMPAYRPFCSPRCADVDLARWMTGVYAIAGAPADESEKPDEPGAGQGRDAFL